MIVFERALFNRARLCANRYKHVVFTGIVLGWCEYDAAVLAQLGGCRRRRRKVDGRRWERYLWILHAPV